MDPTPATVRELRHFGFATGTAIVVMFGLLFPWLTQRAWPVWPWCLGAVLAGTAAVAPRLLRVVHVVWMRAAKLIGALLTPIVTATIFFGIVTPLGLLRRSFGGDPMARALDRNAASYRKISRKRAASSLKRPY